MDWRIAFGAIALAAVPADAFAGPFTDFESELRAAYGHYRAALFQSNSGNAQPTEAAITAFISSWGVLEAEWSAEPPPQYADDPEFAKTFVSVGTFAKAAADAAAAGHLPEAHETLEGIRDEIGALHLRNGIVRFSDRMNAYHAVMEEVLSEGVPPDGLLDRLREQVAVLKYLADEIAAHPAPEAADPAYSPMVEGLLASVSSLQDAVRRGDVEEVKAGLGGLKMQYAKLFAKFG